MFWCEMNQQMFSESHSLHTDNQAVSMLEEYQNAILSEQMVRGRDYRAASCWRVPSFYLTHDLFLFVRMLLIFKILVSGCCFLLFQVEKTKCYEFYLF